jgi:hypothetical protein
MQAKRKKRGRRTNREEQNDAHARSEERTRRDASAGWREEYAAQHAPPAADGSAPWSGGDGA